MSEALTANFEEWRARIVGKTAARAWRGGASVIFVELGKLRPRVRPDGTPGGEQGEFTVMLEWGWRVEDETSILCGSDNEYDEIDAALPQLVGRELVELALVGRLPELSLDFPGGLYLTSFAPHQGNPRWTILDHSDGYRGALGVKAGKLVVRE